MEGGKMIGSTLKSLLAERRLAVGELARQIDVPVQTLYSIIRRDNMKIDFDMLLRICDYLNVPVEVFCPADSGVGVSARAAALQESDWTLLGHYRALDDHGRQMADLVIAEELARIRRETAVPEKEGRIIPLYLTPAAAGYASPALGEDYEDYTVAGDCAADFAVRIDGDSMEPVIRDGSIVLVQRSPIENGDVGMFFIDGNMKCKQYCRDNFGNVYLLSLNRMRADADVVVSASSGVTLCCFGKVLLERRPPLPV